MPGESSQRSLSALDRTALILRIPRRILQETPIDIIA